MDSSFWPGNEVATVTHGDVERTLGQLVFPTIIEKMPPVSRRSQRLFHVVGMMNACIFHPQATFDTYYRDLSKYEYDQREGVESPFDLERFRQNVAEARVFIPGPDARILEIGCSTARLLSLLKEAGFGNLLGLDPSPSCARAAKRLYGIDEPTTADFGSGRSNHCL